MWFFGSVALALCVAGIFTGMVWLIVCAVIVSLGCALDIPRWPQ